MLVAKELSSPAHTAIATSDVAAVYTASGSNSFSIAASEPSSVITITVTDGSGRCPTAYQDASSFWNSNVYTEIMQGG